MSAAINGMKTVEVKVKLTEAERKNIKIEAITRGISQAELVRERLLATRCCACGGAKTG